VRLGDLLLTEKEASGLVIKGVESRSVPRPRWAVVGKVCSPHKLLIGPLERAMQRAWGLHGAAQFKDIGDNRFVVRFTLEGEWRHVMKGGPWQFDFSAILLKNFDGSTRPSDLIFDSLDVWVRVSDLPLDMMNRVYGELIGGWIGKFISVDVDDEGLAWGEELRIRVAVKVDQPLVRGVPLKEEDSDSESRWFDVCYEKIPHFCFDCGCLLHGEEGCLAVQGSPSSGGGKQWGEWLRASPRKSIKQPPPARPSRSSGSFDSRGTSSESRFNEGVVIRDLPPRRPARRVSPASGSSYTGRFNPRADRDITSPDKRHGLQVRDQVLPDQLSPSGRGRIGKEHIPVKQRLQFPGDGLGEPSTAQHRLGQKSTFRRKQRSAPDVVMKDTNLLPPGNKSKKRGTKQVWLPVNVQVVGEEDSGSAGKRQRTSSVFDRLEDPTETSADPARQGRREQ
jgi:hypothetical protein